MAPSEKKGIGYPFPSAQYDSPDALVAALDSMCGGGGKGKKRSIRKTSHHIPHMPSVTITSYTCPENLYAKDPPILPTLARGLFVRNREAGGLKVRGGGKYEIVTRGYDKFFNVGETKWTTRENLQTRTVGPYEATLKENGCIIFLSAVDNDIVVTSKHSIGPHAEKGREWLDRHVENSSATKKDLVDFLTEHKVTAVFELADDDFEEHILEYPVGRRGLYLHGINENTPEFVAWPHEKLVSFAQRFGFFLVDCLCFNTFDEVMEFTSQCGETGSYNGRAIEGFVVRCKSEKGTTVFFKIKYAQPYLMYREWREFTKMLITNKAEKFKPRHELTRKYIQWAKEKIRSDRGYFDGYLQNKGIIKARNQFLADSGIVDNSKELVDAAQETTAEFKRGEATIMDDGDAAEERDDFKKKNGKSIMIIPVGIVGLGKSTLGKCLSELIPNMGHIQSDNYKKRFVEAVMAQFKVCHVVYADKCNHLGQHRRELAAKFKSVYPNGKILALEWDVSWHEQDRKAQLLKLATSRIEIRGENHQTLTPRNSPDYARVVNMFLNQFTPLNPSLKDDILIDAIITIDPFSTTLHRIKQVYEALNLDIPSDDIITQILSTLKSEPTTSTPLSIEKASPKKDKKKRPPSYYGILINHSHSLTEFLDALFTRLRPQDPSLCELWDLLQSQNRIKKGFHVTLAVPKVKEHHHLATTYSNLIASDGVFAGGVDTKVAGDEPYTVDQWLGTGSRLPHRVRMEVDEVVFDDRVMCVPVKIMADLECANKRPHITVGTRSEKVAAVLSNEVLEVAARGVEAGGFGKTEVGGLVVVQGERFVKVSFGAPVELFGYVSEFYF
ncbi:RNA ligase-domain-containing protein [Chytridium lagenaria]|nr:RNA ligase-domain-containing protein [Chytridium lagenaria]